MHPTQLDTQALEELLCLAQGENANLLNDLIRRFIRELPSRLKEIHAGLLASDPNRVERAAHSLCSSSGALGARDLAQACRALENDASGGAIAYSDAKFDQLEAKAQAAAAALSAYLKELSNEIAA